MPLYTGQEIPLVEANWQKGYKALISSPMFDRVRLLGAIHLPIAQARADLGSALQADVDENFKRFTVGLAITLIDRALTEANEGLSESDRSWLEQWNQTHNLGLTLPAAP